MRVLLSKAPTMQGEMIFRLRNSQRGRILMGRVRGFWQRSFEAFPTSNMFIASNRGFLSRYFVIPLSWFQSGDGLLRNSCAHQAFAIASMACNS